MHMNLHNNRAGQASFAATLYNAELKLAKRIAEQAARLRHRQSYKLRRLTCAPLIIW